jgi:hypothetical protein
MLMRRVPESQNLSTRVTFGGANRKAGPEEVLKLRYTQFAYIKVKQYTND